MKMIRHVANNLMIIVFCQLTFQPQTQIQAAKIEWGGKLDVDFSLNITCKQNESKCDVVKGIIDRNATCPDNVKVMKNFDPE